MIILHNCLCTQNNSSNYQSECQNNRNYYQYKNRSILPLASGKFPKMVKVPQNPYETQNKE